MAEGTIREQLNRRVAAMTTERSSFMTHYTELSDAIQPRRGRFIISDVNKGDRRHQSIINSKGTQALRTATAGMLAGVMSPSRPWFALVTPDPDLMEFQPVKEWLYKVELILRAIFNQSNLYSMAPVMISELLLFGTGLMTHVDDFENVARFYTHTAGSYMIAQNDRLEIDTFAREWEWTVEQTVSMFGLSAVSDTVKNFYDRGMYNSMVKVTHCVYPNRDRQGHQLLAQNKAWASVHYEPGCNDKDKLLRRSGFDAFPGYAPRWGVTGEDIYGTDCPGMIALGDVRGLQIMERRKAQAIDKMVNPPLHGPSSLLNRPISALPGGTTLYDQNGAGDSSGLRPIYLVQPNLADFVRDIEKTEMRIGHAFYEQLWLAITSMEGVQPRNQFELAKRDAERLLQLGPVLERLHGEFLGRMIDATFNQAMKAKILPPPPKELENQELKIDYISTLAQAQRQVATGAIDSLAAFGGGLVKAGWTGALDKFDADQAMDEYAYINGAPPRLIVPDDVVAERRAERAQKEQAAQAMQMANMGAQTAKSLADTKTEDGNLLTRALGKDEPTDE